MLFRVNPQNRVKDVMSNKQIMKNYIEIVLNEYQINKIAEKKLSSFFVTSNISKEMQIFESYTTSYSADKENVRNDLIVNFVNGRNLDGSASEAINGLITLLNTYDPTKATKEESENYDIYEGKIGQIWQHFGFYLLTNEKYTQEYFNEKVNFSSTVDGDEGEITGPLIENLPDTSVNFLENFDTVDTVTICRDIYRIFFEDCDSEVNAVMRLSKLYNIILYHSVRQRRQNIYNTIIPDENLTKEEWADLEELVDKRFKEEYEKSNRHEKMCELKVLHKGLDDSDMSRILQFFTLLIKSNISLDVKATEYFRNLDIFKLATINSLDDFKEIMDSTKIDVRKYPKFPLLKDTNLERLRLERKKINKGVFPNSMEYNLELKEGSRNDSTSLVEMSRQLRDYLSDIIKMGNTPYIQNRLSGNTEGGSYEYDFGIPYLRSICGEDIKKSKQLLTDKKEYNIKDYMEIYEALYGIGVRINREYSSEVVESFILDILRDNTNRSREKLQNMWKIINEALEELLLLESMYKEPKDISLETCENTVDFMNFKGYLLPKLTVHEVKNEVVVKLFDTIDFVMIPPMYTTGSFYYKGVEYLISFDPNTLKVQQGTKHFSKLVDLVEQSTRMRGENPSLEALDVNMWLEGVSDDYLDNLTFNMSKTELSRLKARKNLRIEEAPLSTEEFLDNF